MTADENPITLNFPQTGKYLLPAGTTIIKVKSRKVILPNSDTIEMYAPMEVATCRSFLIFADNEVDLRVSIRGVPVRKSTIFPSWTRVKNSEFDELEVTADTPTTVCIEMSNAADGVASVTPL